MVDATIVQPMPKTETIMPAKPFIMEGPLPGFILFMKSPPKIFYFILPYFCEKARGEICIMSTMRLFLRKCGFSAYERNLPDAAYIKTDIIKKFKLL